MKKIDWKSRAVKGETWEYGWFQIKDNVQGSDQKFPQIGSFLSFSLKLGDDACDCKLVGSCGDGFGFFPSEGSDVHPRLNLPTVKQDIDINMFLNTLTLQKENVQKVPGAPGFVSIKISCYKVNDL